MLQKVQVVKQLIKEARRASAITNVDVRITHVRIKRPVNLTGEGPSSHLVCLLLIFLFPFCFCLLLLLGFFFLQCLRPKNLAEPLPNHISSFYINLVTPSLLPMEKVIRLNALPSLKLVLDI